MSEQAAQLVAVAAAGAGLGALLATVLWQRALRRDLPDLVERIVATRLGMQNVVQLHGPRPRFRHGRT